MNSVSMLGAIFGIDTWFYKLLYSMMQGILNLVDEVYKVVLTLCGLNTSNSGDSLLGTLAKDDTIKMVFKWLIILGVVVLVVVIAIASIRAVLSRKLDDPVKAQKGIAVRTISSIVIMVLIPIFFFTFITLVSDATQYIINSMNVNPGTGQVMDSATDWSVAQEVFETATNNDVSYKTTADNYAMQFDISPDGVNYIIGIFGGSIVLVAMFMMGFKLAERIFMLIFYYIISPIILAISPLDDGSRFGIWRDSVIAKLLASGGIIVCISLFLICMPVIKNFVFAIFGEGSFTAQVFNLLFIISGSFFASRGGEIIANLVGDNIGANEGRETADSLRKATAGLKIGSTALLGGVTLSSAALIGSKMSRSAGVSNTVGESYNSNNSSSSTSGGEDGKATKRNKLSSLGAWGKDHIDNFRRYGVLGGVYHNTKNDITNTSKAIKSKHSSSTSGGEDGKATKQ